MDRPSSINMSNKTTKLENGWTSGAYIDAANNSQHWKIFSNWIHCICIVTFDLELGQALESVYPKHVTLSKQEILNVCYLAFPDSNSSCMGDTSFTIRLLATGGQKGATQKHLLTYNSKCSAVLQVDPAFFWGYVYFRQVKDPNLPRGYFQKSVVILSRLPFNHLFSKLVSVIAPDYFSNGPLSLEAACRNINQWPSPNPGTCLSLPVLGTVFQSYIPPVAVAASNGGGDGSGVAASPPPADPRRVHIAAASPACHLNLYDIFQPVLGQVDLLWELVVTAEPLIVMASSPTHCSSMVLALTRMIAPISYCADHRPYFTIHDTEFKQFTSKMHGPPPVILGVTNPFFAKTLHHWPHTIRLCAASASSSSSAAAAAGGGVTGKSAATGLFTSYKPFLQKDKAFLKILQVARRSGGRPAEVQSALLRKHLLELTHTFMMPLERYVASLMPLLKNISPFKATPTPLPFNPDHFIATLENAGPQLTTGIKGDWCGLYRRFFRSPNFNGWFNARHTELVRKLHTLQLEALCDADFKLWVHGKPEVELVDMVLKIKSKIIKQQDDDATAASANGVKEQLEQRLMDIIESLPDDLRNILNTQS